MPSTLPLHRAIADGEVLLVGQPETDWLGPMLTDHGHHSTRSLDVEAALASVQTHDPDLIVLQADPPGGPALAFCAAVFLLPGGPRPVVVTSVSALPPRYRAELIRAGAWECVTRNEGEWDPALVPRLQRFVQARRAMVREQAATMIDRSTGLYDPTGLARRAREVGALAFRAQDPFAAVVLSMELEPDSDAGMTACARRIADSIRACDIPARLSARQVAILAPRTDSVGAVRLAERCARAVRDAETADLPKVRVALRGAFDATTDGKFEPVPPVEMVARAAATLRDAPAARWPGHWLRRARPDQGVAAPPDLPDQGALRRPAPPH